MITVRSALLYTGVELSRVVPIAFPCSYNRQPITKMKQTYVHAKPEFRGEIQEVAVP